MIDKTNLPAIITNQLVFSNEPLHIGSLCPNCSKGKLDYNGLLELECPICGYRNTGGAVGT